jgi:hypothetical protein
MLANFVDHHIQSISQDLLIQVFYHMLAEVWQCPIVL